MFRIGFVGVPGAGKTTTARMFSGIVRSRTDVKTVELVSEYARRYISKYGPINELFDQIRILNKQLTEEQKFESDKLDLLVTDSPVFLGLNYAFELRQPGNNKHTMLINDLFKEMNKLNEIPRYDIIFHLPPVLKPVADGVRPELHFDDEWRKTADERIKAVFQIFKPVKLITVRSTLIDERVEECLEHFTTYRKDMLERGDILNSIPRTTRSETTIKK